MIDWERIKRRLAEAEQAAAEPSVDGNRMERALRKRAQRLVDRREAEPAASPAAAFLIFRLGEERYGLGLDELREVLSPARWTPFPGEDAGLLGVMNFRGEIRPVWDLARLLGISREKKPSPGYVLMAGKNGREAGLLVDRAEEMRAIAPEELAPAESGIGGFLKGWTKDRVLLLDLEALFNRMFSKEEKEFQ